MIKKLFSLLVVVMSIGFFACTQENGDPKATGRFESINSGTFTCYVDESVWEMMQPVFNMYDSAYKEIHPKFIKSTSREAMAQLLATNTDAIITPRGYLYDEDSLMSAFGVKEHQRAIFAVDGLVFFTLKDFPIDTLNKEQLRIYFTNEDVEFKDVFQNLGFEPEFICSQVNSSEYANLNFVVADSSLKSSQIKTLGDYKAVIDYVKSNKNAIGIAYLSQIVHKTDFKMLRIGFVDSTGKQIYPKYPVHQANLVRGLYPYKIYHYIYLMKAQRDRVYWFAKFLEREHIVQSYFNNYGIVPAYAKIKLIKND